MSEKKVVHTQWATEKEQRTDTTFPKMTYKGEPCQDGTRLIHLSVAGFVDWINDVEKRIEALEKKAEK